MAPKIWVYRHEHHGAIYLHVDELGNVTAVSFGRLSNCGPRRQRNMRKFMVGTSLESVVGTFQGTWLLEDVIDPQLPIPFTMNGSPT